MSTGSDKQPSNAKALQLKDEGNAFYGKQQYQKAYQKYTQAIALDEKNAVLYANRAACLIGMKRWLDAAGDAKKATECDPMYSKAWARYATALEPLSSSKDALLAWRRAVATLPLENITPSQLKLRQQYLSRVALAEAEVHRIETNPTVISSDGKGTGNPQHPVAKAGTKFPWIRAVEVIKELRERGEMNSSAYVIAEAYEDFSAGVEGMYALTKDYRNGMAFGRLDAIDGITNGIMRDRRVFHISDGQWMAKYRDQTIFEATNHRAWQDGGPEVVLREAKERLAKGEDWQTVRPAIGTTVRAWILKAFLMHGLTQDPVNAVQWYDYALDVIERGRKVWKNVLTEDRGVIFEETFRRGVKALRLECFMQACFKSSPQGTDPTFHLDKLMALADDLIEDCTRGKRSLNEIRSQYRDGPGFYLSFYVYPLAEGFATKAICYRRKSKWHMTNSDLESEPEDRQAAQSMAADLYMQAVNVLPEDEEQRAFYLSSAICSTLRTSPSPPPPLSTVLPLIDTLEADNPKMLKIWENSAMGMGGRDGEIGRVVGWGREVRQRMRMSGGMGGGRLTMDSQVRPGWVDLE